ncbi:hypothetical protein [Candidatus Cyanaurora vandensis]|uniref:hypothetical protein n=1 Tax=Candidatus Cyanaurora vandensis TaxID=2714958 RepID=UPI00257D9E9D|nr:hypothetical protein [Candidatus Cyanaurora vandensis]
MMDTHQRLLGTLRRSTSLNVGDIFTSGTLTYAVVNIEGRPDQPTLKRLMVIPINRPVAAPSAI